MQVCKNTKKTWKKKKKQRKWVTLKAHIYLKNGWYNLLQIWYVFFLDMYKHLHMQQIWSCSDKRSRSYERVQNCTLFFMLIHSGCVHAPFPWAIRHTTMYLDNELNSRIIWSPSTKLIKFSSCFMYVCWSFVTTHQFSLKTARSNHY